MFKFFEAYAKHAALNFGQALQGIRYFYSHPDIDAIAPRKTLRHFALSVFLRSQRIGNDLFFALIPPHWHHSAEEIEQIRSLRAGQWFQFGYCAWRFDETGAPLSHLPPDVDKRWDPRCQSTDR